jgi:hypothetical protein
LYSINADTASKTNAILQKSSVARLDKQVNVFRVRHNCIAASHFRKLDLRIHKTCTVLGISGHSDAIGTKTQREGGLEWRLSKFTLSVYCRIPCHADLVYINQLKVLVASEVYHTVKYV